MRVTPSAIDNLVRATAQCNVKHPDNQSERTYAGQSKGVASAQAHVGRVANAGNQDNRTAGAASRPLGCMMRLVARPSGPISKLIRPPVAFTKKIPSLSADISNAGP